jgi:predicted metal-dependent peptidase
VFFVFFVVKKLETLLMQTRLPNQFEQESKQKVWVQAEADRGQLLLRQPFIGSLIMRMDIIPVCDYRLNTAATDGSSIFIDCKFYSGLDHEERLFLLAHEVWHCVFLHFARRMDRDRERWNIAADLEIQFAMDQERMKNPCPLPFKREWIRLNAEEIYERLTNKLDRGKFQDVHLEKGADDGESQAMPDNQAKAKKSKESRKGVADPEDARSTISKDKPKETDSLVMDPDYSPYFVPDIIERTRGRIVSAARQCERMRGTLPAGINSLLEELLDPKLRWQELLAQFVTSCYAGKRRWLPPSRRHVAQGLYLPSMRGEKLKAIVAIDTSGSTTDALPMFFGELSSLLTSFGDYELTVIQCDAAIQKIEHFNNYNPLPADHKWRLRGFGGTDFRPVFQYVADHPELEQSLLIFFTDGCGLAPQNPPPYPVLWILCDEGQAPANWGRSIQL